VIFSRGSGDCTISLGVAAALEKGNGGHDGNFWWAGGFTAP